MKKAIKQSLQAILFLFLALFLLWISFKGIDLKELWAVLRTAHYWWLLPAIIASVLSFLIRARRWILLIEPLGYNPELKSAFHSVVTGYFANMILPRLGEVTKCAALGKKEKIPFDKLVGTMLIERTIDILSVLVILGITILAGSTTTGSFLSDTVFRPAEKKLFSSFNSVTLITLLVVIIIITAFVLFFVMRKRLSAYPAFQRIYQFADGLIDGLKSISRLKKKWEFILLTIVLWICYLLMSFFPMLCLPETSGLGLGAAMFILVIGSFGMAVPVQSGLGAYHWIISRGMLVAYAIPLEQGLAYATLEHESQLLLIAIMGAFSMFVLFGKKGGKVLASAVRENEA